MTSHETWAYSRKSPAPPRHTYAPRYRREIDGLRAVAVLPVIFFHAGFVAFGGGYVGVDVFFVISGYLITRILQDEIARDAFTLAFFYERRIRRIVPALLVVIAFTAPFAWAWMSPQQLEDFAASVFSVALGLSNFFFLSQVDYFSPNAELQPLMHTWSLAIEEQYYFLFPAALYLLRKLRRPMLFAVLLVGVCVSFAICLWGMSENPARNFFFTLSRFWEIGFGALLAVGLGARDRLGEGAVAGAFAGLGLVLIFVAIFLFSATMPYPGPLTLVPVLGTGLVILFAGPATLVGKLLAARPFVGIGLISYSAYLWHQPLFALLRLRSVHDPSPEALVAVAVASLLLAGVSWRFVEQPLRKRRGLFGARPALFGAAGACFVLLISLSLAGYLAKGVPARFDAGVTRYLSAATDRADRGDGCFFDLNHDLPRQPVPGCAHPDAKARMDVLLLGDSHALAISEAVGALLERRGIGYYDVGYGGCIPLPGFHRVDLGPAHRCAAFDTSVLDYAAQAGVSTIVLTARYTLYLEGHRYDNGEGGREPGADAYIDVLGKAGGVDDPERRARVLRAYEAQIRDLAKRFEVVLVAPVPEPGWNVPQVGFKHALFRGRDSVVSTSYAGYQARNAEVNALFERLAAELARVRLVHTAEAFCEAASARCVNADAQGVYYFDSDHPSQAGARRLAPLVVEAIEGARAAIRP
ncbi:acyltransferase family protein [Rhodobacter lacus]|uniref:Acyltransferase family protein n=1 Tax=Rhodobacter lacus TaxID=1641972 RepID=A0ABW5ABT3_9RHOB